MTLRGADNSVIPTNCRVRAFWFTQNIYGAELQMNTNAKLFDLSQLLHLRPVLLLHDHAAGRVTARRSR